MGSDSFALFSSPSSLHPVSAAATFTAIVTVAATTAAVMAPPAVPASATTGSRQLSTSRSQPGWPSALASCVPSSSSSSSSPSSPPLSPRSQFAALTVRIPPSSPSATTNPSTLALPTLPTTLTDPSQLRLFWPHHYYGADIDRLTAPLFQEWKQRPFYLASLREANRRNRHCLRCSFNPAHHTPTMAPLTPPTAAAGSVADRRPTTPPVVGGGSGVSGGFIECVRAPRKPWYSVEFMKELSRRERECSTAKQAEKGRKRLRDEKEQSDEEGRQMEGGGEQCNKRTKPVSWEAEEVSTLTVWSGLPPLPISPTKSNKRPLTDSSPLLNLPLSPTPSSSIASIASSTIVPSSNSSPTVSPLTAHPSATLPLSPVSVLCGSMTHLLSPLSTRNDVRLPARFQRMSHSPLFRKQRRVLPPVPKMDAA